jgi:DNA-binding MarR family transcriptional regulator
MNKENELSDIFFQFTRKMISDWNNQSDGQISVSQSIILGLLEQKGSKKMTEIAEYMDITLSAVTSLSDKLIKGEYVKKVRDKEDKRISYLVITENGKILINEIRTSRKKYIENLMDGVSDEEKLALIVIYQKMITNANNF